MSSQLKLKLSICIILVKIKESILNINLEKINYIDILNNDYIFNFLLYSKVCEIWRA